MLTLILSLLTATTSYAAPTFNSKCPNLEACTKAVSDLTGEKYIFNKRDYEIRATATNNVKITKENAVELLSRALFDEGYTRVPMSEPNTFSIMHMRDARDTALPEYRANSTTTPPMPDHYDTVQLVYQMRNEEAIDPVCRYLRSILPAHSRVLPNDMLNAIVVTSTARDLKKTIATIREMDIKPTAAMKLKWAKQKEEEERKAKSTPPKLMEKAQKGS